MKALLIFLLLTGCTITPNSIKQQHEWCTNYEKEPDKAVIRTLILNERLTDEECYEMRDTQVEEVKL